jgi:hypothetical protein
MDRVQKFRSIEEMNKAVLPQHLQPQSAQANFERFVRLCARVRAIAPKRYPRGVFRFRSMEEAQKAREKYS